MDTVTADVYRGVVASIQAHEGLALHPLPDAKGSLVIGYGRSLTFTGISKTEAEDLLEHDLADRMAALPTAWPPFTACDGPRQAVVLEMAYQLGVGGLLLFPKMLHAIAVGDYETAAREVLASSLATQTQHRAQNYAALLRTK